VVRLDRKLETQLSKRVVFEFDPGTETLAQVLLEGERLLVLKTARNIQNGGELRIVRVNLVNGESIVKSFDAGPHLYVYPTIRYNTDSSILVSSVVRESIENSTAQRVIFVCRLGDTLQELTPVSLLRKQFRNRSFNNFLLIGEGPKSWVHLGLAYKPKKINQVDMRDYVINDESTISTRIPQSQFYNTEPFPASIRFSLLDRQLQNIHDSVVRNDDKSVNVKPLPFGRFAIKNKAYLLLIQNYTNKKRGLLMVSGGGAQEGFEFQDIHVAERYEYLLLNLQSVNDYFILPYTYKNEIGLVKVTIRE